MKAETLGARVKRLRSSIGMRQEDLAALAETEQTVISRIESRPGYEPGAFTLSKVAKALGVTLDELLATQPASAAEKARRSAEVRIPKGPYADAIQALRGQVKIALDEAREARRLAEEAVNQGRRRGKRSA